MELYGLQGWQKLVVSSPPVVPTKTAPWEERAQERVAAYVGGRVRRFAHFFGCEPTTPDRHPAEVVYLGVQVVRQTLAAAKGELEQLRRSIRFLEPRDINKAIELGRLVTANEALIGEARKHAAFFGLCRA